MNKSAVSYLGNCRTNICLKNASGAKCSIRVSGMLVFLRALPTAKYCRRCLSSAPHCGHLAYFRSPAKERKSANGPSQLHIGHTNLGFSRFHNLKRGSGSRILFCTLLSSCDPITQDPFSEDVSLATV